MDADEAISEVNRLSLRRFVTALMSVIGVGVVSAGSGFVGGDRGVDARFEAQDKKIAAAKEEMRRQVEAARKAGADDRSQLAEAVLSLFEKRLANRNEAANAEQEKLRKRIRELEYQLRHHVDLSAKDSHGD